MYSKARVAGHPIHPMLVAFPIAFYTATVALLLAYIGTLEAFWYRVAMVANLAGIVTAAIAVLPGAIDLFSLPAKSRARATGLKHAGFNLLATGLFAVTAFLLYRGWTERLMINGEYLFDATIPLAMSVVAWVSMVIAGSLGWTLVQTHHVGIKPALTRADRPSRDPELEALEHRERPEPSAVAAGARHDTIDERGLRTAPTRRSQPSPMRP
ncbi:MAG TPA: DUF2231 domain-containing protein [Kofleriaceae bacterium]|nr:DUF2231 domain-containing protein [Kofleriaceae bacterium]